MSYIVKALRKLEQERRRVTVTEIGLFRGLSERWQSEKPVWRYLLALSLVVNTGVAVWLLTVFLPGGSMRDTGKLTVQSKLPSIQSENETVAEPVRNGINPGAPIKISLEVRHPQRAVTRSDEKTGQSGRPASDRALTGGREKDVLHALRTDKQPHQNTLSVDGIEMHENGSDTSSHVMTWKDEKGNIHFSGTAGKK